MVVTYGRSETIINKDMMFKVEQLVAVCTYPRVENPSSTTTSRPGITLATSSILAGSFWWLEESIKIQREILVIHECVSLIIFAAKLFLKPKVCIYTSFNHPHFFKNYLRVRGRQIHYCLSGNRLVHRR
jgi:hypothetical protein